MCIRDRVQVISLMAQLPQELIHTFNDRDLTIHSRPAHKLALGHMSCIRLAADAVLFPPSNAGADKLILNHEMCIRDRDSRMTLGQWLDRWLTEYKAGTVRPGTLEGYRRYIEYYIKPQLGDKQISLLSQQDIQRMYRRLKTEGRIHEHPEMGHQLSDSMVRHIHSCLLYTSGAKAPG